MFWKHLKVAHLEQEKSCIPSTPMDVSVIPESFTTFPVRVHQNEPAIARGAEAAHRVWRDQSMLDFDKRTHSFGPCGNFFALSWPEGETQRVSLCAEIIECLWIYDDVIEEIPHSEAQENHKRLCDSLLDLEVKQPHILVAPVTKNKKSLLPRIFDGFGARLTALDPVGGMAMIEGLKSYLSEYDRSDLIYSTIEEYIKFRGLNVGFGLMEVSMQWCLDLCISPAIASLSVYNVYYASCARVMALTNDYFSWTTERDTPTDRPRNAVPILMQQYNLTEPEAKIFLKGLIVDAEQTVRRLGQKLRMEVPGDEMRRYLEAMGLMLGGNCFWSATCPRYNLERFE